MFKITKVRPMFTGVITTANKYVGNISTDSGLILPSKMDGQLNLYQWVVSVGPMVTGIKEGDIVRINLKRYAVVEHAKGTLDAASNIQHDDMQMKYEIPMIPINGKDYLFLQNNDIEYVVEGYEGVDEGGLLQ